MTIKIKNKHIIAEIITEKLEDAFEIAIAISKTCDKIDKRNKQINQKKENNFEDFIDDIIIKTSKIKRKKND